MSKIDTTNWHEFVVKDVFVVKRPVARSQANYENGNVNFVASGNYNNGVLKRLKPKKNEELDKGNCITVSPIDGSAFYQEKDFLGRGGAGSSVILLYNDKLNIYVGYFIATVIRSVCSKYMYNDMANKYIIGDEKIKLPIDKTGNPDFSYMESYMRNLEATVSASLTKLQSAKRSKKSKIVITKWKTFHLYDIFEINSGTKLDKIKMDTSIKEINFVGRSNFNNGITQKVKKIKGLIPYKAGNLTLALGGAYLGSCFIQENEFYTSQNVVVLIPKSDISFLAKQFIATTIFKESQNNYQAFIKELNAHIKRDFSIMLPAKYDGSPDYDCMESYMEAIEQKTKYFLQNLRSAI